MYVEITIDYKYYRAFLVQWSVLSTHKCDYYPSDVQSYLRIFDMPKSQIHGIPKGQLIDDLMVVSEII